MIRYDLGDSITMLPGTCACGSPLPAIRVEGRREDVLYMRTPGGATIPLLPVALAAIIEETPGVHRYQLIQTAPDTLKVRLQEAPGSIKAEVWKGFADRLRDYLSTQGLALVKLKLAPELPERDSVTRKFREIWTEPPRQYQH